METGGLMIKQNLDSSGAAELIARARAGDVQSFDDIMSLHQQRVFRTAFRILGHMEDAQDAAQEVFLRLYKYLDRFDTARPLAPWLYRMTVNVCNDIARKRPKTDELNEDIPMVVSDNDLTWERQLMTKALKLLPEKERAAIVLRDIEGLSSKEVAEILGSSETTIRSQISRARIKLKEFRDRSLRRQS